MILYTDFSMYGFGLLLVQQDPDDPDKKAVVFCDSTKITQIQSSLPVLYRENLALAWALSSCHYFLRGCPHFIVLTNGLW